MVRCKCGYEWRCRSHAEWICCPSCHRKFRRPAPVVEVLGEQIATDTPCDICCGDVGAVYPCRIDGEAAYLCPECLGKLKGDST
jgi:hypothetical protein